MHWKSSFLLHFEAALKISEPAEAHKQINTTVNQMQQHPSLPSSIQFQKGKAKKTNPFLFAFPPERTVFTFRLFRGVGKELRLWQVDCPVKSWLRVLSVNECQALSATFLLGLNGVTYSHFHKSFSSFYIAETDKITHISSSILSFCTKGRKEDVCRRSINPGCSCSD